MRFRLFAMLFAGVFCLTEGADAGQTRIAIVDGKWHLNGRVTYPGAKAEGLLMNVRMVNCTFEDMAKPGFDADANTTRFIAAIPDYKAHGVRAFTLCLQGGLPGYEGAVNSAFNADGSLREPYLKRVARVIDACDEQGIAVILGCYYQRQTKIFQDDAAIRAGVVNAVNWIKDQGWGHVTLEVANEYPHRGFTQPLLRSAKGEAELIRLAKQTWPELLVSTSGIGNGRLDDPVAEASDFLLIHFNGTPVEKIPERIGALKRFGKPIVCNEDDKTGTAAAEAAEACVVHGASWGLMLNKLNQYVPFEFKGAEDDPVVYAKMRALTTAAPAAKGAQSPPLQAAALTGRIAWSADGNFNDEDDWAASPFALAILARAGLREQLVHFDYNCILYGNDPAWAKIHEDSVLGAVGRFGFDRARFHNCQTDLEKAIASIRDAINASTALKPLFFVLAGPMEVPLRGMQAADPAKLQHVFCISHSRWNDGFDQKDQKSFRFNKRAVIEQGVRWVQITDQNRFLSTSPYGRPAVEKEWQPWMWMRESPDADLRFLWDRLRRVERADCSDAGMAHFLISGDEESEIGKVRAVLEAKQVPAPVAHRRRIRLEAENFTTLQNGELSYKNDRRVSHRISVQKSAAAEQMALSTRFDEPFTAEQARYDVQVRCIPPAGGIHAVQLLINDASAGAAAEVAQSTETVEMKGGPGPNPWRSLLFADVSIARADVIRVRLTAPAGQIKSACGLDYVELKMK